MAYRRLARLLSALLAALSAATLGFVDIAGASRDDSPWWRPSPGQLTPVPPADGRDAPDPFALAAAGGYWLYTTQVGFLNVPVASSPDVRAWSPATEALPELPAWAEWGSTWAPGVARLDGRYVLYFASRHRELGIQCIGAAAARSPAGPFTGAADEPLVCQPERGGSIDPNPYVSDDGRPFLLWKADSNAIGKASTLFAQPLRADGLALEGEPSPLLRSGAYWEDPLIENPALVATGDAFVLFYSAGWWESDGYATGYATCESPVGPCTKQTIDHPLFGSGSGEAGPGGASVVSGPAGDQWLAYHAWTAGRVGYDQGGVRALHFARLVWHHGLPEVAR